MKLEDLVLLLQNAVRLKGICPSDESRSNGSEITKAQAYSRYGRSNVDRWIKEGLLKIPNNKIDKASIEAVAAYSNRISYLATAERK